MLSSPIVKEQIWSKRFTQNIIDTLGGRLRELVLPWPMDAAQRAEIGAAVKSVMADWKETVEYDFIVLNG